MNPFVFHDVFNPWGVVLGLLVVVYGVFRLFGDKKSSLPLPPISPASGIENFKNKIQQKGLFRIQHITDQARLMHQVAVARDPEAFKYGIAFRMAKLPILNDNRLWIYVTDYKLARLILLGDKNRNIPEGIKFSSLSSFNFANRNVGSLFTAPSNNVHRELARKYIAPAFSTTNLTPVMSHLTENILRVFHSLDKWGAERTAFDMKEICLSLFIETLTKASFNVEFCSDRSDGLVDGQAFLQELDIALRERALQAMVPYRQYMFWNSSVRRCKVACTRMRETAEKVLDAYREMDGQGMLGGKEGTIMNRIMTHSYPTDEYRVSEIISFIVAGHETSAFTLCFFLYEMAKNRASRTKLQAELDAIELDGGANCLSHSQVSQVEYLSWCLKESMRLWPVAASGSARTLLEDIEYNGMILPKGSVAQTVFYAIFRSSWIDRPDEFIPERWSDNSAQISELKEMFMPFSLGKRGCIGMNMAMMQLKIIAANFMRYFEFELEEEINFEHFLTIKPEKLMMSVHRRS